MFHGSGNNIQPQLLRHSGDHITIEGNSLKTLGQMIHDNELSPGLLLELDHGEKLLVGHVNSMFGRCDHCLSSRILDGVKTSTQLDWDDDDGWVEGPTAKDYTPGNHIDVLSFLCLIKAGHVVEMGDGSRFVVGHINAQGGMCDASWKESEGNGPENMVCRVKNLIP